MSRVELTPVVPCKREDIRCHELIPAVPRTCRNILSWELYTSMYLKQLQYYVPGMPKKTPLKPSLADMNSLETNLRDSHV